MNKLLHQIALPLAALALAGCGPSGSSFKIKGTFHDMKSGQLYIYSMDDDIGRFDTLTIQDGSFAYSGAASQPTPYILVFPNAMEQVIFVNSGEELEYEATANDLKNYVVNGSPENKLMNKFRQESYKMDAKATAELAKQYIKENPQSVVATYLLDRYFVQDTSRDSGEILQLASLLRKEQPTDMYLLNVESTVKARNNGAVGTVLPDIAMERPGKPSVRLSGGKKPYNLIVFWASWTEDYYTALDVINSGKLSEKKGDKLRILAFSLDNAQYQYEETVREDSIHATHCCDLKAWNSPVVKKWGVKTLPYYILTDKNRKVLATGTDVRNIQADVDKYVK